MEHSLYSRLIRNLGASGLGQLINLIVQIITVPLLLAQWGLNQYGEWLVLSTIPSYLGMSELGFIGVAWNEMAMLTARDDRAGALKVFQSTWAFVTLVSTAVAGIAILAVALLPLTRWFHVTDLDPRQFATVALILVVYGLVNIQGGVLIGGFRCDGHYAVGLMFQNAARVVEFGLLVAVVTAGGGPLPVAGTMLLVRSSQVAWMYGDLRRRSGWLRLKWHSGERSEIRRLARPALTFAGFPLGQALGTQGMLMVVSSASGPGAVAVFSTLKQLAGPVVQAMSLIHNSIWPEMSAAMGRGDLALARQLHHRAWRLCLCLVVVVQGALAVTGRQLFEFWTQGHMSFDGLLFALLLGAAGVRVLWYMSFVVPLAINRHSRLAILFVIATALSLPVAMVLLPVVGLAGAGAALLTVEVALSFTFVQKALDLLDERWSGFLRFVAWGR